MLSVKKFLLQSNIFISICAVALSIETAFIFKRPLSNVSFYTFIFFSTLFAYNIYYLKSSNFAYYKWFSAIGLIGAVLSSFFLKQLSVPILSAICLLSLAYIIPVFISFQKPIFYGLIRLMILIAVWVLVTFFLPLHHAHLQGSQLLFLLHRITLMSILCLLFYIKDETNKHNLKQAYGVLKSAIIIQCLNVLILFFVGEVGFAIVYALISLLIYFMFKKISNNSPNIFYYLFYVDGIMILQTIFVLLKFLFFDEY